MKFLASDPIFIQQFESIDSEKGVIKGVKVCSEGPAKGHGVHLNKKFIRNVAKFGKEQPKGVKARFGHPNMCSTSLGTYIGRYANYRTKKEEGDEFEDGTRLHAVADLYLDDTAKDLPKLGNVWDYVMNMASSSPDMFGNSIVFKPGPSEKTKIKGADGNEYTRNDATIQSLMATDLVDEPAATEGLFEKFSQDEMAMQVSIFLDEHPEVYELATNNPDIVESFLNKYESFKNHKEMTTKKSGDKGDKPVTKSVLQTMLDNIKAKYFTKKDEKGEDVVEIPEDEKVKIDALQEKIDAFKDPDSDEKEALRRQNEEYKTRITELEGMLTKGNAKSTKTKGPEGQEGEDSDDTGLSEEDKSLKADLGKLRGELKRVED